MTDAEIYACWQKNEAKRVGNRLEDYKGMTAVDETTAELQLPYRRVRDVVLARLTGFLG